MKATPNEIGRVVVSTQGHDRGRRFLIVGLVDERHVLIADGDTRKLNHPKKKQRKHLDAEPTLAAEAADAVRAGLNTADSAIRKALRATAPQTSTGSAGAVRSTDKEEYALVQK